ncbi:MAG: prepilin-type N-terminal cleavage/methylation domain-containing protein [Patescibacteria group bacterium]|mgnify:CR=1 FL=1
MSISNNQPGITLIEIMISITLLAVGILGVIQAFPRGLAIERDVELMTIAEQLAQAKQEQLVAASYDEIPAGTLENAVRVSSNPSSPLYDFLRTTTIALVDSNLAPSGTDIGLKKIIISIQRPATFGQANSTTTITSLKAKR